MLVEVEGHFQRVAVEVLGRLPAAVGLAGLPRVVEGDAGSSTQWSSFVTWRYGRAPPGASPVPKAKSTEYVPTGVATSASCGSAVTPLRPSRALIAGKVKRQR